jgi:hypothetical protein
MELSTYLELLLSQSSNGAPFMESEVSSSCSQKLVSAPHLEIAYMSSVHTLRGPPSKHYVHISRHTLMIEVSNMANIHIAT